MLITKFTRNTAAFGFAMIMAGHGTHANSADFRVTVGNDDFKIAMPLVLKQSKDVSLTNLKPRWAISTRKIAWARTAQLKQDLSFAGEHGTYTLKAKRVLKGIVDLGAWAEGDVRPGWLFDPNNMDPDIARLLGDRNAVKKELTPEEKAAQEKRIAMRDTLFKQLYETIRLEALDIASIPESDWLYCGEGEIERHNGKDNDMQICVGDTDGDGAFDRAATITFSSTSGLGKHAASLIKETDFQADFEKGKSVETDFHTFVTVQRQKKDYRLQVGFTNRNAKQIDLKTAGMFRTMAKEFTNGAVEETVFGDTIQVQMAKKKKRVNVELKSGGEDLVVHFPYELKFPE